MAKIVIPTVVERAVERALVIGAVAALTYMLKEFNTTTAAGLLGYYGVKTLIDYLNPLVPNTSDAIPTVVK